MSSLNLTVPVRTPTWRWWVCGLLLLATMVNYMDRLVLNQTATRLMESKEKGGLEFTKRGYGQLEGYFGAAFALGALSLGFVVDRFGPRLVYPSVVLLWSLAGFLTGFVRSFEELLACRIALGFFEAANWSCALKTTQAILRPQERTMGNGILQSGAAVGAILTPLLVWVFIRYQVGDVWRPAFWSVGVLGMLWVTLWLLVVRKGDLEGVAAAIGTDRKEEAPTAASRPPRTSAVILAVLADRRFWVLAFVVVCINLTWHFFRAWMPLFLEERHGYSRESIQWITMAYYLATDVGSLLAGFLALRLARGGLSVHASRIVVFAGCAALTLLCIPVAFMPPGAAAHLGTSLLLLGLLLTLGFAALGLFPNYYSFSQELTKDHQGKVSGMLGCACWMAMYPMQISVGAYVEATKSYTTVVALGGLPPLLALGVLLLFWRSAPVRKPAAEPVPLPAVPPDVADKVTAVTVPGEDRVTTDLRAVEAAKG